MKGYNIYRIILGDAPTHSSAQNIVDFCSVSELVEKKPVPGIVIIDGSKGRTTSEKLKVFWELVELRASVEFCCAPVYFSHTMQQLDMLVDGVTSNIEDRLADACAILEKIAKIKLESLADNNNLRMLAYMYVRGEEYILSPACAPFSQWVYSYPHAALLVDSSTKSTKLLRPEDLGGLERLRAFKFDKEMIMAVKLVDFLEDNGYIARSNLVDRIRKCPKCKTGHLNYLDICPNCGSIDFEKKTMIHCFVCGNVGPEGDFKKNMSFVCPKCGSVLRHLGSDYDHPLESHQCNDCGSRFIEPEVKADCFFCRTRTVPEDLIVKNVYSYQLTEKGSAAARTGSMYFEIQLFDGQNNLKLNFFCRMIEWLLEYRKRYTDEAFSIVGIRFFNLYEVENALGEELYEKLMDELISRIRAMVRTTDMTSCSAPDTFWILLPRTPPEKSRIIADRIEELNEMVDIKTDNKILISAKCFVFEDPIDEVSVENYIEIFSENLSAK